MTQTRTDLVFHLPKYVVSIWRLVLAQLAQTTRTRYATETGPGLSRKPAQRTHHFRSAARDRFRSPEGCVFGFQKCLVALLINDMIMPAMSSRNLSGSLGQTMPTPDVACCRWLSEELL